PAELFNRARIACCSSRVKETPAIFAAASSISRVIRGESCATAINAPGIKARLTPEKHSRKQRRLNPKRLSSLPRSLPHQISKLHPLSAQLIEAYFWIEQRPAYFAHPPIRHS